MARDFDKEIEVAEKRFQETLAQMEQVRLRFVAATIDYVKPVLSENLNNIVKQNSEVTKAHGREKLSQLKADFNALLEEIPGIATKVLDDDSLWWHRQPTTEYYSLSHIKNRLPEKLEFAVRLIAGSLGPTLEKYGYIPSKLPSKESGMWREWDLAGNAHSINARPLHPGFYPNQPEELIEVVNDYEKQLQQSQEVLRNINKIKREKELSEAEDLWDQA